MNAEQVRSSGESAEKAAYHPSDLARVREFAREGGITQPVSDEDARAVMDWFLGQPDPDFRPLPDDWDSPEFEAEVRRRSERIGPVLSPETVCEQLRSRWGHGGQN